ncbi:acyl-CoA thioesterase-2 [Actinobaculum suis]|uniref:Acyl-CoA thioesterase-2 n=1 Tax=Actinobaculum suis TaxID=1657 RepID=A0A1G6ZNH2_9ACTO|nr:acyl-CoA thioesterase domain-containing protein [Actinobaculum suis]MDY5153972.1 thioesterase family protein [Actinobaculum suis]SDE04071.1 acyl-CoA thioesterase-2 [Actinobaculum suis]
MNRVDIPKTDVEPLASVLNNLTLERIDEKTYRGDSLIQVTGRIYGGQVFGQATIAAADHVNQTLGIGPDVRLAHSITGAFLRPGDLHKPIYFRVLDLNDGRSFSTRNVMATQDDEIIFSARVSFQLRQKGPSFGEPQPTDVPDPESIDSSVDFFAAIDSDYGHIMSTTNALDLRHVDGMIYTSPAPTRSPHERIWLRTRSPLPEGTSRTVQRALLGYSADQFMLEPALQALGLSWMSPISSIATLDHSIWWHRNFDISNWILADMECLSAQNGRALIQARFFQDGKHIATMMQEGMVRVRPSSTEHEQVHE